MESGAFYKINAVRFAANALQGEEKPQTTINR